jgi:hypothetical protein
MIAIEQLKKVGELGLGLYACVIFADQEDRTGSGLCDRIGFQEQFGRVYRGAPGNWGACLSVAGGDEQRSERDSKRKR